MSENWLALLIGAVMLVIFVASLFFEGHYLG